MPLTFAIMFAACNLPCGFHVSAPLVLVRSSVLIYMSAGTSFRHTSSTYNCYIGVYTFLIRHYMDVDLQDFKIVSSPGLKHKWKIPAADVKIVDNETFVRLRPFSYTLCGMVFEGNHDAGAPSTSHKERSAGESLTCSHGYNQLVKLRNEACVPQVQGSDLFDVSNVKKPRVNMSRLEMQQKRSDENFETIQLDLDLGAPRPGTGGRGSGRGWLRTLLSI